MRYFAKIALVSKQTDNEVHARRRYHSLNDGGSILTRRSRQSTMSDDEDDNQYLTAPSVNAVDEHGRRLLPDINISSDGSHGVSSAIRPSGPTRRPSEVLNSSADEFGIIPSASLGPRPRPVPLSALPSPTYTDNPPSAANRFSVLAGSITSLFGANRASMASSSMGDEAVSPDGTRRPNFSDGNGLNRQSYAGQPLVSEDVYREALLSGHQAREGSDGLSPILSRGTRQESSGETALSGNSRRALGISSEEGSGETFGVQDQRIAGIRGRVVTPGNRAYEAIRAASGVGMTPTGVGEFGEVVDEGQPTEVLKLPDDARKAVSDRGPVFLAIILADLPLLSLSVSAVLPKLALLARSSIFTSGVDPRSVLQAVLEHTGRIISLSRDAYQWRHAFEWCKRGVSRRC